MNSHRLHHRLAFCLVAVALLGCSSTDRGVSPASDSGYVLELQVFDPVVHIGDQTPLALRLRQAENGLLPRGLSGVISVTTSGHGKMDAVQVIFSVTDDTTGVFLANVVFTAVQPGVAEVRATYRDVSTQVKILVSETEA